MAVGCPKVEKQSQGAAYKQLPGKVLGVQGPPSRSVSLHMALPKDPCSSIRGAARGRYAHPSHVGTHLPKSDCRTGGLQSQHWPPGSENLVVLV